MSYHHLTALERCHIYELHVEKVALSEIARQVGRNKSTISRELRRNIGQRGYRPGQAERLARSRQKNCANAPRVSPTVWSAAQAKLREDWSPEHISGRFRLDGTGQVMSGCRRGAGPRSLFIWRCRESDRAIRKPGAGHKGGGNFGLPPAFSPA